MLLGNTPLNSFQNRFHKSQLNIIIYSDLYNNNIITLSDNHIVVRILITLLFGGKN